MKILKQLKYLREERSLSQRDLAALSGVAYESIGQIERGERKARPSTIRKLADALGVEPNILFAESPQDAWNQMDRVRSEQPYPEKDRENSTRQNRAIEEQLKTKSLAKLAELAESEETPEVRRLIRAELRNRAFSPSFEVLIDPEFHEWSDSGRSVMEWWVAGRESRTTYPRNGVGASMNEDLSIAKLKLKSGVEEELEEAARLASEAAERLAERMSFATERELSQYEALPTHYFEDAAAARRIREIGASMASRQLQDLKMLRKFLDIRDKAELALLKLSVDSPSEQRESEWRT